jgi:hypothetical protein
MMQYKNHYLIMQCVFENSFYIYHHYIYLFIINIFVVVEQYYVTQHNSLLCNVIAYIGAVVTVTHGILTVNYTSCVMHVDCMPHLYVGIKVVLGFIHAATMW